MIARATDEKWKEWGTLAALLALALLFFAANAHLDLASSNFGIQESVSFNQAMRDVFPGAPTMKDGYMWVNEAPGLGVDLDEALALKFPFPEHPGYWEPVRRRDGTSVRP